MSINGQSVKDKDQFREGILAALQEASPGYCVPNSTLSSIHDAAMTIPSADGQEDCCPATAASGEHLCFAGPAAAFYCLPARDLISGATNTICSLSPRQTEKTCPHPAQTCLVPHFGPAAPNNNNNNSSDTATKLVRLGRGGRHAKDFLFVGHPALIYTSVVLSDYCPRAAQIPGWLPEALLKMARYIASFSGALAVLNVVPCYMLDGQHMMDVLMEMGMTGLCAVRRRRLQTTVTLLGRRLDIRRNGTVPYGSR